MITRHDGDIIALMLIVFGAVVLLPGSGDLGLWAGPFSAYLLSDFNWLGMVMMIIGVLILIYENVIKKKVTRDPR